MNILTFNVGSSSIKYSVFSYEQKILSGQQINILTEVQRKTALKKIIDLIKNKNIVVHVVAHRVVHGKDYKHAVIINQKVLNELKKIAELAPLHELPEIQVIELTKIIYEVPHVAVFDTAFHQTIPEKTSIYGLPYKYYAKGIKKYGFHGIAHKYLSRGLNGKVITCHLGNGCSITAIKNKISVDTSMGFTPLDGLMMGTRSGSLDPAILPYLYHHEKLSLDKISKMLNYESGLLGISGKTHDLKILLNKKDKKSVLAVEVFLDRIIKQIGAYVALLDGVDTIVFSGGIGENNAYIRETILKNFSYLGIKLSHKDNIKSHPKISAPTSKVKVLVIPANEELEMVKEAIEILK